MKALENILLYLLEHIPQRQWPLVEQMEPIAASEFEPTPAEIIAGNEDLAAELLIHLPVKSLAPLMWVSKQWLSYIYNPWFVWRHTLRHPPSMSGIFLIPRQTRESPRIQYVSLTQNQPSFPFVTFLNSQGFHILHSSNGLLLCSSGFTYYVCNPTTNHLKILPSCSYMENDCVLNLAFDPLTFPHYKVVCVQKLSGKQGFHQFAVYSSETRHWSPLHDPFVAPNDIDFANGVFCYGAIHWFAPTSSGLYLDMSTEILRQLPHPPRREQYPQYACKFYGQSQGCLYYVISRSLLNHCEIFQMKEDYSGWDLKFRIDLNALANKFPAMTRNFNFHPLLSEYECDVLCISHAGSDEDMEIMFSIPGQVIAFNPKRRTSKKICELALRPRDVSIWYKIYSAHKIFETLSLG